METLLDSDTLFTWNLAHSFNIAASDLHAHGGDYIYAPTAGSLIHHRSACTVDRITGVEGHDFKTGLTHLGAYSVS